MGISDGMFAMNAPYAVAYAFTEADGGGVNIGEFLAFDEVEERLNSDQFVGFVQIRSGKRFGCIQTLKEGRRYAFYDCVIRVMPKGNPRALLANG